MVDWVLTKGLQNLRSQVNARWPDRDRDSDGTIGDAAHAAGVSGHNPDDSTYNSEWDGDPDSQPEVRAWDMDSDLGEPGTTAQMVVDHIRRLPRVETVIRYIIWNHKIYRASNGYEPQPYRGKSPHTEHIHFSGAWSQSADNNTTYSFKLEEVGDMALTDNELKKIQAAAKAGIVDALADGYRAASGQASGSSVADRSARHIRDYLRAIVGGPTEDDVANAQSAILEQLKTVGGVTLTDAQAKQIAQATVAAIKPVEVKVDSLRQHLGDA